MLPDIPPGDRCRAREGRIGFHVGSLGEEAAILGSAFAMARQDFLFPCYREFGAALMRGLPYFTTMSGARAALGAIAKLRAGAMGVCSLQEFQSGA